jgi:hypothetical protein
MPFSQQTRVLVKEAAGTLRPRPLCNMPGPALTQVYDDVACRMLQNAYDDVVKCVGTYCLCCAAKLQDMNLISMMTRGRTLT